MRREDTRPAPRERQDYRKHCLRGLLIWSLPSQPSTTDLSTLFAEHDGAGDCAQCPEGVSRLTRVVTRATHVQRVVSRQKMPLLASYAVQEGTLFQALDRCLRLFALHVPGENTRTARLSRMHGVQQWSFLSIRGGPAIKCCMFPLRAREVPGRRGLHQHRVSNRSILRCWTSTDLLGSVQTMCSRVVSRQKMPLLASYAVQEGTLFQALDRCLGCLHCMSRGKYEDSQGSTACTACSSGRFSASGEASNQVLYVLLTSPGSTRTAKAPPNVSRANPADSQTLDIYRPPRKCANHVPQVNFKIRKCHLVHSMWARKILCLWRSANLIECMPSMRCWEILNFWRDSN